MRRTRYGWLAAFLVMGTAAIASAQPSGTSGQAQGQAAGQADMKGAPVATGASAEAQATAAADLKARQTLEGIKEKGAKVSSQTRAKTEAKLQAIASKVDESARSAGDATVAARLAAEFGTTADQMTEEKTATGCSWGALTIAHTLDANSAMGVTARQLVELQLQGTAWSQIAAGLGMKLSDVVAATQAEGRVAAGAARPDSKCAVIKGEGARVGLDGSVSAGVSTVGLDLASRTGVGVGIKIKP